MKPTELLDILRVAEKLKCNTRHCVTSTGRPESVAEHSWRLALMAMLLSGEFPELDMDRVIRMCLIHDLGEAFTGDIPTFEKTDADSRREDALFSRWLEGLPLEIRGQWQGLWREWEDQETVEARLAKALDRLEAVIQHDESDIATWLPLEYSLQLTYGAENVREFPCLRELKNEIDCWTREKIARAEQKEQ